MPFPVNRVTIHHEGGGTPSDVPRGASGGYTYWIGATYWTWLRDVWSSYATKDYNHVSLDICLSGNRMTSPVTDNDIKIINGAVMDARSKGYVVNVPDVVAHKNSPGSATACPGDHTMNRWSDVVSACQVTAAPTPKPPKPVGGAMDICRTPSGKGYWIVAADGGVFSFGDAHFYGSMGGKHLNAPVVDMAVHPSGEGYWLVASDGGVFNFGKAKYHGGMGDKHLNAPIVGIDCDKEGDGYWLLAQDGGVFTFGKTNFFGAATGKIKYP